MNRYVSSLSALTILFAAIVAVSCEPEDQENRDIIESLPGNSNCGTERWSRLHSGFGKNRDFTCR